MTNRSEPPLAERMRPLTLDEFVGQSQLLEPGSLLRRMIEGDQLSSFILWGPPGVGKTTLARIIAKQTNSRWSSFSAVTAGIKEIKAVMADAQAFKNLEGRKTVLFVDEIHRFNKSQQDAFLPYLEDGTIVLIGATTENPSFELNSALLSRLRVLVLKEMELPDLILILQRALKDSDRGLGGRSPMISEDLLKLLATYAGGDARTALNGLELAAMLAYRREDNVISEDDLKQALQKTMLKYDKNGDYHYDLISALHKSMRNSDVDASVYWLARMLESGEDPMYVARRLVRFASEDIGLAHPQALSQTVAAMQAVDLIGMPECSVCLTQAVVYLALAPKSNAIYKAYLSARSDALNTVQHPVPLYLRNASTTLMKDLGYGQGYQYAHDLPEPKADMDCLPADLKDRRYYRPTNRGFEGKVTSQI